MYWSVQYVAWSRIFVADKTDCPFDYVPAVSVVICGKNEAANIRRYLFKVLSQNYPNFEVIFVDDHSTDESLLVLGALQKVYSNLVIVAHQPASTIQGKKSALTRGIDLAQHDIILLTDADCYPQSDSWIRSMTRPFHTSGIQIVIGYSPYEERASLLNRFIRFETAYTAISYLGFAKMGRPYMGVGRNLCYRKSIFLDNDGFKRHAHVAAGDDDLFVNEVADSKNTTMVVSKEAWVCSVPKVTLRSLIQQKIRHVSVSKNYRLATKIYLGMVNFSQMWIHILIIILLILKISTMFVGVLYILCIIAKRTFYGMFFNRFHNLRIILSLPLFDFLLSILFIYMSPTLFFRKLHEWK